MQNEQLFKVLLAPLVSEKGAARDNQYVFKVLKNANKKAIKESVELFFNVKVKNVRTLNTKGKPARFGRTLGRRKAWKKAYITLMPGEHIEMAGAA